MAQNPSSHSSPYGEANGRIFTIPPGAAFLPTLARALIDGTLIAGFHPGKEPLSLSAATIYLPTRRAARVFAGAVAEAAGGEAVLLPSIQTLGDDPDDAIGFARQADALLQPVPVISAARRRAVLARLVRSWTDQIAESTRELFGDEDIVIPSSLSEAIRMAGELGRLLDQFEVEEVAMSALASLRPHDELFGDSQRWAEWWQLTLQFLAIITRHWPGYLQEAGMTDLSRARREALDARAAHYLERGSDGPVIIAGTTGSVPATARLVSAIAQLPQGAVVLPGVDRQMGGDLFDRFGAAQDVSGQVGLATHAQYSLARLLHRLSATPGDARQVGTINADAAARAQAVATALLPAEATGLWAANADAPVGGLAPAFRSTSLIEAANEREEALAIAIALREAIEQDGAVAALVTPDRKLARRVSAELYRFGIEIDDSAGVPLTRSDAGLLVRQLIGVATGPADPVMLAAFAKQDRLAESGSGKRHDAGQIFELAVLRGAINVPMPGGYASAVDRARASDDRHAPAVLRGLEAEDWVAVREFAALLDHGLQPLAGLRDISGEISLNECFGRLAQSIAILFGAKGKALADLAGGAQLLELIDAHAALQDSGLELAIGEFADTFDALLEPETVRHWGRVHPRLHIWGPLEARLQHADTVVLGGLNEGGWPTQGRNDAFLNRPMRSELGLALPEWRIGQAAHDFQQLSGHDRVIYSRSLRDDNAPTVASRWLQRLEVTLGPDIFAAIRNRGNRYLQLARSIDANAEPVPRSARPAPRPDPSLRPKRLSVTEIETWIRDPYAIYAKHVLRLEPLPPLQREPDALLKGRLYHTIAERFMARSQAGRRDEALFRQIAEAVFAEEALPASIAALWLPRVLAVGAPFVEWQGGRNDHVRQSLLEAAGSAPVGESGFLLTGRADRIDRNRDESVDIIDYKTGVSPSIKQARTLSPQLALEAMMARRGAFGAMAEGETGRLLYVRLRTGKLFRVDDIAAARPPVLTSELVETAWHSLEQLVIAFENAEQPYMSRRAPFAESETGGTYDHLARVREWSIGEIGEAGGE